MRTLKIGLVIVFCLVALMPLISPRVAALTGNPAQTGQVSESANKSAQSKQSQKVETGNYVGSDSCAECHTGEANHYALTAHSKTTLGNSPVDKRGCEACHGPARGHLDFYLNIQKMNEAGKEDEATALMNDEVKAAAAKMLSFKEM
ncbi:MAG: hypothetical protein L0220_18205, partial [Acidobacteria bacterium]|nr:hypothetical protein [Acidobacteriota bacterium]